MLSVCSLSVRPSVRLSLCVSVSLSVILIIRLSLRQFASVPAAAHLRQTIYQQIPRHAKSQCRAASQKRDRPCECGANTASATLQRVVDPVVLLTMTYNSRKASFSGAPSLMNNIPANCNPDLVGEVVLAVATSPSLRVSRSLRLRLSLPDVRKLTGFSNVVYAHDSKAPEPGNVHPSVLQLGDLTSGAVL